MMAKSRGPPMEAATKRDVRLLELWLTLKGAVWWILQSLYRAWELNPISLIRNRIRTLYKLGDGSDLPIKPRWTEFLKDIFTSDVQRKIRLLQWVKSRVDHVTVDDFIFSWHDGIALCALLESVCPGVCPNYRLLRSDLQVNSCRFALQVAHKFLGIQKTILTPEEMAIADQTTEIKIVHLVQMIRWKHQRISATATADQELNLPIRRVISRCFARGAGLKSGTVGRRAKFNIFADTNGILEVLVEIRGPKGEMNSEKISTLALRSDTEPVTNSARLKPPKLQVRSKVISDERGNTFIRQKSFDEHTNEVIPFDYQSEGEGRFLVTYIPRNSGIHVILIKSHKHHIQGSPFEANISECESPWNVVKSNKVFLEPKKDAPLKQKEMESLVSKTFLVAGSERARRKMGDLANKYRVKRRILKKVITRNGEETSFSDYSPSPTLSRQSSTEYSDVSEDLRRSDSASEQRMRDKRRKFHLIKQDIYIPDEISNDTSDSLSIMSTDSAALTSLENSVCGSEVAISSKGEIDMHHVPGKGHPKMKHTLARSMFRRSLSDSLIDDVDVVYNDVAKPEKGSFTSLKMLKSKSLKTRCFYVNNSTVFDSTGSPDNSFSVSSKPSLAETQKMTRKWQSMDLADIEADKLQTTDFDPEERNSSKTNHSVQDDLIETTKDDTCRDQEEAGGEELPSTFRCIDSVSDADNSTKLEHVDIQIPREKVHKTTQVSATEIKHATGWHSGAFKIKKRRTRIYPSHEKSMETLRLGYEDIEDTQNNEYNVHQWLQQNGKERHNVLEDRQSTVDTSDSGIADDSFHKQHQSTRQRATSNSQSVPQDANINIPQESAQALVVNVDTNVKISSNHQPFTVGKSRDDTTKDHTKTECIPEEKQLSDQSHAGSTLPSINRRCNVSCVAKDFDERRAKDSRIERLKRLSIDRTLPAERSDDIDHEVVKHVHPMGSTIQRELSLAMEEEEGLVPDRSSWQQTNTSHTDLSSTKDIEHAFAQDVNSKATEDKDPTSSEELFKDEHETKELRLLMKATQKDSVDAFFNKLLSAHSLQSMEEMLETNPFTGSDLCCLSPGELSEEENCLAFGAGLSFGHVGIKNNFQVWVRDDKKGSVNVSVCGPRPNCVTETTTLYTGDNLYEIFYQVTHPGYYVITVKYALNSVPNSPFIAKVAWDY